MRTGHLGISIIIFNTVAQKVHFISYKMEVTALLIQSKLKFLKNDALKTGMSLQRKFCEANTMT
jgi:hypothetical protein